MLTDKEKMTEEELKQAMDEMYDWYDCIKPTLEELDLMAEYYSANVDGRISGFDVLDDLERTDRANLLRYLHRVIVNMEPTDTLYVEMSQEIGFLLYEIEYSKVTFGSEHLSGTIEYCFHDYDTRNMNLIFYGVNNNKVYLECDKVSKVWVSRGTKS